MFKSKKHTHDWKWNGLYREKHNYGCGSASQEVCECGAVSVVEFSHHYGGRTVNRRDWESVDEADMAVGEWRSVKNSGLLRRPEVG